MKNAGCCCDSGAGFWWIKQHVKSLWMYTNWIQQTSLHRKRVQSLSTVQPWHLLLCVLHAWFERELRLGCSESPLDSTAPLAHYHYNGHRLIIMLLHTDGELQKQLATCVLISLSFLYFSCRALGWSMQRNAKKLWRQFSGAGRCAIKKTHKGVNVDAAFRADGISWRRELQVLQEFFFVASTMCPNSRGLKFGQSISWLGCRKSDPWCAIRCGWFGMGLTATGNPRELYSYLWSSLGFASFAWDSTWHFLRGTLWHFMWQYLAFFLRLFYLTLSLAWILHTSYIYMYEIHFDIRFHILSNILPGINFDRLSDISFRLLFWWYAFWRFILEYCGVNTPTYSLVSPSFPVKVQLSLFKWLLAQDG